MNLTNKRILITGATGGVGSQLAEMLSEKGAILALAGRNTDKLIQISDSINATGSHAITITADLNQENATSQLIGTATESLGGLDIVICNAGVSDFVELDNQTESNIDNIIQTNVTSLIKLSKTALKHFKQKESGHFVFIGSILGSLGFPHFATYCASKFAVHGFSQALRRELAGTNIGVTYIAPRGIKTAMTDGNTREMFLNSGDTLDTPIQVANKIVVALEKEKDEVFIGHPQTFFAWLNGLAPSIVNFGLKKQVALAKPFLKSSNTH